MVDPRIEILPDKKLIGMRMLMTFAENKTSELWRSFMPRRNEIKNNISTDLFSLQIYSPSFFAPFKADAEFEKWAAMEVADFLSLPGGMKAFHLQKGLYAVFHYQGDARNASPFFQYIFNTWLINSAYELDDRPHFEILGEKYKKDDAASEEEIWIPVRIRNNE